MNRRADVPRSLLGRSQLPAGRVVYFEEADESVFREVCCGVLFVMAFWSGPSVRAFAALTEVLARLDPGGKLQLVVVDTDGLPEPPGAGEFFDNRGGHGEAAWVRDGRIVSTSGRGFHPECFEPNTADLLAACPA